MIRANLLPRPKERLSIGSIEIDTDFLRQIFFALLIVLIVAGIGIAIEMFRLTRLEAAAAEQEARIALDAPKRAELKSLALEVARYQSFANEAQAYRRSGADVAIELAKIGNSVPSRVWLDSIQKQAKGYDLAGGAKTIDTLGTTIVSLGRAMPQSRATLLNIENGQAETKGVRFTAQILTADQTTPPVAAPNAAATARRRATPTDATNGAAR